MENVWWLIVVAAIIGYLTEFDDVRWFPFRSAQAREIFLHMTTEEKRHFAFRMIIIAALHGLVAALFLAKAFILWGYAGGAVAFLLMGCFWWLQLKYVRRFLASTCWARGQGLISGEIKLY